MFVTLDDLDTLARTIYGEARGEFPRTGIAALMAVANVVLNRSKRPPFWKGTVRDICLQPKQFSCWSMHDPNFRLLQNAIRGEKIFDLCWHVAKNVLEEKWPDITKGADHYHAISITPSWAMGKIPLIALGGHLFYQLYKENVR
ncbi:MAG: cell wall hydrolase [Holosporales bacterium]|jgi:spore germination cell wall hydrolase CwlJ-like protein|nr:cell wall hydrolase [Holosporales bacterium]